MMTADQAVEKAIRCAKMSDQAHTPASVAASAENAKSWVRIAEFLRERESER